MNVSPRDTGADAVVPVWEKHAHESARSFAAFVAYRDEGPLRSLRRAAATFYGSERNGESAAKLRQAEAWSARNNWVARAAAYDRHLEQIRQLEQVEAVKEMCRRHADLGAFVIAKAAERIEQIDATELSVREAVSLLVQGSKLERLSRGEPSVLVEETVTAEPHPSDYARAVLQNDEAREMSLRILEIMSTDDNWPG